MTSFKDDVEGLPLPERRHTASPEHPLFVMHRISNLYGIIILFMFDLHHP